MNPIVEQLFDGNEVGARLLIEAKGTYIAVVDDRLLMELAALRFAYGVRHLAVLGANLSFADDEGNQAIHLNCCEDDLETLDALIFFGADVNARNLDGQTPLMLAGKFDRASQLKRLIEKGACVTSRDSLGRNALHYCSMFGDHVRCVDILLQSGADPNDVSSTGKTAVDYAIQMERRGVLQLYLAFKNKGQITI